MVRMNKKGQLISLFWGALLIFVVSFSVFISLIMVSSGFGSKEVISEEKFETDFFGPVVPVVIQSNYRVIEMLNLLVKNPTSESDIYSYFEEKLESHDYDSLKISIVSELGSNNYYVNDEVYSETFYYIYNSSTFVKLELVMNIE